MKKKKKKQLKTLVKLASSLGILCVNLLYRNRCLSGNKEEISERGIETFENCPKYLCSQIDKAALRATRHNGHE